MRWDVVETAFLDELTKLGEINLLGLSPETALGMQPAPPMNTPGLDKAMAVLDRVKPLTKTAAPRVPYSYDLPSINTVTGAKKMTKKERKKQELVNQVKSFGGHTAGGMGIGRMAGYVAQGPRAAFNDVAKQSAHGKMWWGTVAGGAIGAGEFARKKLMAHLKARKKAKAKEKTAAGVLGAPARVATPGISKRVSSSVGHMKGGTRTGPTLGSLVGGSRIGGSRRF